MSLKKILMFVFAPMLFIVGILYILKTITGRGSLDESTDNIPV